jgi:cell division protein ZapE
MSVLQAYAAALDARRLRPDPAQAAVAQRLDALAQALSTAKAGGILGKFFGSKPAPLRGLYVYGEVGRGKTMLMDLFFAEAEVSLKRRIHFHPFMQDVHARLHAARKTSADAIAPVVKALAAEARLLCLDEMQIADIADAMIVGRLFEGLLAAGTVIVTTSNLPPTDLYRDGLNRQLFLPFIKLISEKLDVVALDSATDYRLGRVKGHESFVTPLSVAADARVQELWRKLTDTDHGEPIEIDVMGRKLKVPQAAHACARFSFAQVCEAPLGPADYLALTHNFRTLFVEHIPVLAQSDRNPAKRFVLLIDTLYDAKIRLVASAAAPAEALYPAGDHRFEFARTVSRLKEMQSASWWGATIVET